MGTLGAVRGRRRPASRLAPAEAGGRVTVRLLAALAVDRRTLAQLTQVQLSTYEPWVKQDLSFRGVWLTDVLALAGAAPTAAVRVTALDDYTVDFTAADLRAGGILV